MMWTLSLYIVPFLFLNDDMVIGMEVISVHCCILFLNGDMVIGMDVISVLGLTISVHVHKGGASNVRKLF